MTTRRSALSLLAIAAALGLGACGSTEGGIPGSDADTLRKELSDVARFVEEERCDEVDGQVRQVRDAVVGLPNSVDTELLDNLNEGVGVLEGVVATDCQEQAQEAEDEVQEEEVPTTETTEPPEEEEEPPPEEEEPQPQPDPEPQPDPAPQPEPDLPSDELPPPEDGLAPGEFGP
ncbi:MAG: hypothetical protein WKF99_05930 [Solirubrobacteraceae bacterium]